MTSSFGHTFTPDSASEHVKWTVTGPVYQPLLPSWPATTSPVIVGAVLSSFTVDVVGALVAGQVERLAEDVEAAEGRLGGDGLVRRGLGRVHARAQSSSFASKCTVTSELFHSSAFGAGVTCA